MAPRSTRSSKKGLLLRARLLADAGNRSILSCGADPSSLPYMAPKLVHRNLLIQGVKLYAANILKQSMLSIGGDVAVHRNAVSGKVETSDCLVMGDLRHFRLLIEKLKHQKGLEPIAEVIEEQIFACGEGLRLKLCGREYSWERTPVIMGILNITPDSFSDGGAWHDPDAAITHALEMVEDGADIIDVGGESSRPGAGSIDPEEEMSRVIPVIEKLSPRLDVPLSIDTRNARTAEAAVAAGACIINDISALTYDSRMLDVAKRTGAGLVLMHMRGTPETMQTSTDYHDIVSEIFTYLEGRVHECLDHGIAPYSLLVDPGVGFGKDLSGNLSLIHHIAEFKSLKVPVVLGHSRKSFIGSVLNAQVDERQEGTDAVSAWAVMQDIEVLRVHDIRRTRRVRDMMLAIKESP